MSKASVGWTIVFVVGVALTVCAVLVGIDMLLGLSVDEQVGASATGHSTLSLAVLLAGVGLTCVDVYLKRVGRGGVFGSRKARLSGTAGRRIIWTVFVVEVAMLAWIVFHQLCPNDLALDAARAQLGAVSRPHGMARCWIRFLSYSGAAALIAGVADVLVRRTQLKREARTGA